MEGIHMNKPYSNKDFYCTAYLLTLGYQLTGHYREGPITIFQFKRTKALMNAVSDYYAMDALVEPMKYGQSFRLLKGILHNSSGSNTDGELNNEFRTNTRKPKSNN
jgi:hypothetical protein